jgi:hypothetical protein
MKAKAGASTKGVGGKALDLRWLCWAWGLDRHSTGECPMRDNENYLPRKDSCLKKRRETTLIAPSPTTLS